MSLKSELLSFVYEVYAWMDRNFVNVTTTAIIMIIVLVVYRFISNELENLREREILDLNTAFIFKRLSKWTVYVIFGVLVFHALGIKIDFFLGLWVLAGGTIIGFASMSTIGNALAGLIIMLSAPFRIRDRLFFQDQYVIVEDIDLIYTRMRTLDNVSISVPNQILLDTVIKNQSVHNVVRRAVTVTSDYSENPALIRDLLLAAVKKVENVSKTHRPSVCITDFPNYALEYTLYYYIRDTMMVQLIDSEVREKIIEEFRAKEIDLSTPNLVKSLK
jgi:small-conductance mechanosensitive channel